MSMASNFVLVMVHCSMRLKIALSLGSRAGGVAYSGSVFQLASAGAVARLERRADAECQVQAGAGIADLRARDGRRAVAEAGRRRGAAGALRHVLVDLAVLVRAGTEALHRGDDHARVELVDV